MRHGQLYVADPSTPDERLLDAPGAPVTADKLVCALDGVRRPRPLALEWASTAS